MKRVLILLLFVLVAGCNNRGPDSDWECPSCHWGVGRKSVKCPNCGDAFESVLFYDRVNQKQHEVGNVPVKREK